MSTKPYEYKSLLFFLLLFVNGWNTFLNAQILPPDFICIKNDTLIWNPRPNTCGDFNSIDIFSSSNFDGPYSLLTSISDFNQNNYFNPSIAGDTVFYYLKSNFNCIGQTAISSDTLDNLSPQISPIENVTVENNQVKITWTPSPSPEVRAHIIYRKTTAGTIPIDTSFSDVSFTDNNARPNDQSETYFVVAIDDCGNNSIFDQAHETIYLTTKVDSCLQTISLNWNLYQNWPNGIGSQEIWLSINNETPSKIATVLADATNFIYENANDNDEYCFYLEAIQEGTSIRSRSNEFCELLDIIQPMRNLVLTNATVTPNNEISLQWIWEERAEINTINILSNTSNTNYQSINSETVNSILNHNTNFTYSNINPIKGPHYFVVETIDNCNTSFTSTYASTILLKGTALKNSTNELSWTPLDIENGLISNYELYKISPSGTQFLVELDSMSFTHIDEVTPEDATAGESCYFVIANYQLLLPNGAIANFYTRSNTICVEQQAIIYTPNAFAPYGLNQTFKPIIAFGQVSEYQLVIYDRWGRKLFESNDLEIGWDGKLSGKVLSLGSYVYYIRAKQNNGFVIEDKGVVVLLK